MTLEEFENLNTFINSKVSLGFMASLGKLKPGDAIEKDNEIVNLFRKVLVK